MPDLPVKINAVHGQDAYVIRVQGELDLAGCLDLNSALMCAEHSRASRIILDLEEMTFIDSSGVEALLRASRRSASNGNHLQITRGKGYPAEMFRLTALDQTLPLTDPSLCPAIAGRATVPADAIHPDWAPGLGVLVPLTVPGTGPTVGRSPPG